ncbi:MAG: SDR family NAD(P)-dependent oxidoreductase [Bacteroidales bacterium]|nr:SDR family NAD(P)-dependent oxidoreductase [Bacteroidales bacterium]
MAKIQALKLQEANTGTGTLLFAPVWEQTATGEPSPQGNVEFAQQHIVLCDLPNINSTFVETAIANSHCLSFQTSLQKNIAERFSEIAQACFELIKKTLSGKPNGKVLLQVVIPNNPKEALFAGLSGLLKTAALENPLMAGQIILTMPKISVEELVAQLQSEKTKLQDKIISYGTGVRSALRLQEVNAKTQTPNVIFKDRGVYLITGGLGGLGLLFAKEILKQTSSAKIFLAGRSTLTPERKKELDTWSKNNKHVEYNQLDITNFDDVNRLLSTIKKEHGQLNGIIHCAGINADNYIIKKTTAEFHEVLKPKVIGTYNLDTASHDMGLDFMVLFSSVASWLGNAGQADYAAANCFMDQFAVYRNNQVELKKRKGKTLSVNWPLWEDGGMTMDMATREMLQEITGLQALQTSTGMLSFYRGMELNQAQVMVMNGDYEKIRQGLYKNNTNVEEALPAMKALLQEVTLPAFLKKPGTSFANNWHCN